MSRSQSVDGMSPKQSQAATSRSPHYPRTRSSRVSIATTSFSDAHEKIHKSIREHKIMQSPLTGNQFDSVPTTLTPAMRSSYVSYGIGLCAILAITIVTGIFSRAHVVAAPAIIDKQLSVPLSDLRIETTELTDNVSIDITAGKPERAVDYARGTVRIFNKEANPQTFSPKTRIADKQGKIYYLPDSETTVPAMVNDIAGTRDVLITAADPGPSYNQSSADFVFVGWKEIQSPKYLTQYGQSITEISGGFDGERPAIDSVEAERARFQLQKILQDQLSNRITKEIPSEWIIIPRSMSYRFSDVSYSIQSSTKSKATITGTVTAQIAHRYELGELVARGTIHANKDVRAITIEQRDSNPGYITAHITAERVITTDELFTLLQGKTKKELVDDSTYNGLVSGATTTLHPVWAKVFPKQKSRAIIEVQYNSIDY
jgi:hypothetical protein